jgi:hypothetical protein
MVSDDGEWGKRPQTLYTLAALYRVMALRDSFTCPPQWGLRSVRRLPRSVKGKAGGTRFVPVAAACVAVEHSCERAQAAIR